MTAIAAVYQVIADSKKGANLDNIAEMQINAITLYVRQSINLMLNAWYAIGGS